MQQWPHSASGCFASGCEFRLRDNPCCPCGRGEADGERNNGRAHAEGGSDWHSHWSSKECLELSQNHGHHQCKPPHPHQPDPQYVPWCPWAKGMTPSKTAPERQMGCKPPWRSSRDGFWHCELWNSLEEDYWVNREVNATKQQQQLAWLQRAPQGRALSGSGGKRRTPVWWIRLANSLEETKRRGARWASIHLKGRFHPQLNPVLNFYLVN